MTSVVASDSSNKEKAVFLDRDGTINKEIGYLYKYSDWEFVEGSDSAIELIKKLGYLVVVITNQSGVAREYYTEADVDDLHQNVNNLLWRTRGVVIDAFYICPHHPDYTGGCECRKPKPGMLLQAASELNIDLTKSYMIGDKWTDVQSGLSCGCNAVLVKSGHSIDESKLDLSLIEVYENLYDFAKTLLCNQSKIETMQGGSLISFAEELD